MRLRRVLIGSAVALHFAVGLLCNAGPTSVLLRIPGVAEAVAAYHVAGLPQTWRMFAPPAENLYELQASLKFAGGWSDLVSLDRYLVTEGEGRFFLPRGYLRVANHMRHPIFRKDRLEEEPFFWNHLQQMSAFFCKGAGRIEGLEAIRIYSVVTALGPLFELDAHGEPVPSIEGEQQISPIYERECSDR